MRKKDGFVQLCLISTWNDYYLCITKSIW